MLHSLWLDSRVRRAAGLAAEAQGSEVAVHSGGGGGLLRGRTGVSRSPRRRLTFVWIHETLQFIFDLPATLRTLHRILKPGGVLLLTLPGISRIDTPEQGQWGEYWRFTCDGARRLFGQAFPEEALTVQSFGNVLSATSFLYGLATNELDVRELDHCDPNFQVLIGLRAVKPLASASIPVEA